MFWAVASLCSVLGWCWLILVLPGSLSWFGLLLVGAVVPCFGCFLGGVIALDLCVLLCG